jgi:hypothetical protein
MLRAGGSPSSYQSMPTSRCRSSEGQFSSNPYPFRNPLFLIRVYCINYLILFNGLWDVLAVVSRVVWGRTC